MEQDMKYMREMMWHISKATSSEQVTFIYNRLKSAQDLVYKHYTDKERACGLLFLKQQ